VETRLNHRRALTRGEFAALGGGALLAGALCGCAARPTPSPPPPIPEAAPSYDEAVRALRAVVAADAADAGIIRPALPRLYEHGHAVRDAVVLFHGFTNCPQQFDELARMYFARGCNVYVPRVPRHGLADRLTLDLSNLTVAELQQCAQDAYHYARGLGENVSVLGLSMGGSMALWLAQTQPVHLAVPIAPFLMLHGLGRGAGDATMRVVYTLPSWYQWWDPKLKAECLPLYAYPGFPSHALAVLIFCSEAIFSAAARSAPRARACVFVLNAADPAINDGVARDLLATWNREGANYRATTLTDVGAHHDVIDPTTFPQGRTLVYPTLLSLVLPPGKRG